jgi:hypothetical protein
MELDTMKSRFLENWFAMSATLEPGDHLDQKTFHERYCALPKGVKAELIGGVVYIQARMKLSHGRYTGAVAYWLASYAERDARVVVLRQIAEASAHSPRRRQGCWGPVPRPLGFFALSLQRSASERLRDGVAAATAVA